MSNKKDFKYIDKSDFKDIDKSIYKNAHVGPIINYIIVLIELLIFIPK